jgi:hypothetical protein
MWQLMYFGFTIDTSRRIIDIIRRPAKNKIAKHLIMKGEYKPDPKLGLLKNQMSRN